MKNLIGQNIKFLRKKHGLSQDALASLIKMKRGNIASYEGNKARPSAEKLLDLANYFKVDIEDLIQKDLSQLSIEVNSELANLKGNSVEGYRAFNERLNRILSGMKEYHDFKQEEAATIPNEYVYLYYDCLRLMELLETILHRNLAYVADVEQVD